jgi:Protein involved in mRNA turnover and stability
MTYHFLHVKVKTSLKEYFNLFDYESDNKIYQQLKISSSGFLHFKNKEILFKEEGLSTSVALKVLENNSKYIIYPLIEDATGVIIRKSRPNKARGHKLFEGDKFRLGKVVLQVKKISLALENENSSSSVESSFNCANSCRICFGELSSIADPLVSLCRCTGSMKHIHLKCLQKWLVMKSKKTINLYCISYG